MSDEKSSLISEVDERGDKRGVRISLTEAGVERTSPGWRAVTYYDAIRGVRVQSRVLAPDKVFVDTATGTIEWTMRRGKAAPIVEAIEAKRPR